ncbi:spondin domain-containing protein [Photobacterium leiognathi]|uniref:spondin domain-containing protein n=1 Tax=Photobacterium leiognathi TaxID=553611 RepID=UPI002733AE39|nr:spondin domain-containing protein [Photobacterium leiognathi]
MKLFLFILFAVTALFIQGCGGSSDNDSKDPTSQTARYTLDFDSDWDAANFPTNYPTNRHFSGLIGLTHNAEVKLFEVGQTASAGVISVAETGSKTTLESEIGIIQNNGNSGHTISGNGIPATDDDVEVQFDISQDYPLVSVITMLAPSPDWFTGVDSVALFKEGKWQNEVEVQLWVYDAGSDSGIDFTAPDFPISPPNPIYLLTTLRVDTDFQDGVQYQTKQHIGTFKFERID